MLLSCDKYRVFPRQQLLSFCIPGHPFEKKAGYSLEKEVPTMEITIECSQKGFHRSIMQSCCADIRPKRRTEFFASRLLEAFSKIV
jgi:hypothetical protein